MKKILKRLICAALVITLSGGTLASADDVIGTAAQAGNIAAEYVDADLYEAPDESVPAIAVSSTVAAKSAVLMEVSTGAVLFEQNADERLAPASITKIMSILLITEALDSGKFSLDTVVSASDYACSMGGSQIWLEPNETMTVDELLRASVIASANDATVALAELVAGTEEMFVEQMNGRAKALGMENTTFYNATGLDAESHLTTARDVGIMSCELLKHEIIKNYSTVWMDTLRGGQSELVNTNKLVRFYEGATGLKTGTTSTAGHCLSASAVRNGMEIVAVVMGCESSKDRFNSARQMLDYGFAAFARVVPDVSEALLNEIPVTGGVAQSVAVSADEQLCVLVPKGREKDVVKEINLPETIAAPVTAGEKLGEIIMSLDGNELGRVKITAASDVEKMSFLTAFSRLLRSLFAL